MGQVSAVVKVFPEEQEKLAELKEKINSELNPQKIEEEEIAFGAKALKVTLIVSDEEGGDLEGKFKSLEGVSEVTVERVDRV